MTTGRMRSQTYIQKAELLSQPKLGQIIAKCKRRLNQATKWERSMDHLHLSRRNRAVVKKELDMSEAEQATKAENARKPRRRDARKKWYKRRVKVLWAARLAAVKIVAQN